MFTKPVPSSNWFSFELVSNRFSRTGFPPLLQGMLLGKDFLYVVDGQDFRKKIRIFVVENLTTLLVTVLNSVL
ncbi:hypothetical protein BpHYR1_004290 [Brachionus plicatilis]|uniref:Uncharacterized protein n=1 Tax=Brachionus plicatilis TaxID=10195 RepID=A0A3M7SXZ4_BRAPC|nr:hypothetical protein BpHYR1_004290 [Brachionus plicatilis]